MNTILVLTDFTIRAQQAAEFALQLAARSEADLILCNAIEVVKDGEALDTIAWPLADHITLREESYFELRELEIHLTDMADEAQFAYKPQITTVSKFGKLAVVASEVIKDYKVDLTLMGVHRSNSFLRFLLGSHTHQVIDNLNCPVLLIPEGLNFSKLKNITYATDLTFNDNHSITYLASLAQIFGSEILISHISPQGVEGVKSGKAMLQTVNELFPAGQPKVSYINVKGDNVPRCLMELGSRGHETILALVHKRYSLLEGLFHSSISKRIADTALIPLLVLPYSFSTDVTDLTEELIDRYSYDVDELR